MLADEMGVGKTVQAIAMASCYRVSYLYLGEQSLHWCIGRGGGEWQGEGVWAGGGQWGEGRGKGQGIGETHGELHDEAWLSGEVSCWSYSQLGSAGLFSTLSTVSLLKSVLLRSSEAPLVSQGGRNALCL